MSGLEMEQSIPICCALAALGGVLEVIATAVLAYPAARSAEGFEWTDAQLKGCLAANIILQILASLAGNLFATWFGPVAIVGPIFFATQLLANLIIFWIVLGLEAFSREMQIGTYVIVVAVVLLIINGPETQDYGDTTFQELITEIYAMIWACILCGGLLMTGLILMVVDLHKRSEFFKYLVLLTSRATGFALNLSTGKALVLPTNRFWFIMNIVVKIVSGGIYTRAIVVQSTAVEQKIFVPLNAASIVFINAITGIIIWEDWRVVNSWVGYGCVFLLLALGCGLLLGDLALLQETKPEMFMGARMSMVVKENRKDMLDRLKNFGKSERLFHSDPGVNSERRESVEQGPVMRRHTMVNLESPAATGMQTPTASSQRERRKDRPPRTGFHRVVPRRTVSSPAEPRSENKRRAWLSVYEGGGAAPRCSVRISMRRLESDGIFAHSSARELLEGLSSDFLKSEMDSSAPNSEQNNTQGGLESLREDENEDWLQSDTESAIDLEDRAESKDSKGL